MKFVFWTKYSTHNSFELQRVFPNIKLNLLSDQFSTEAWNLLMEAIRENKEIHQQFKDNGMDIAVIAEVNDFQFNGNVRWTPSAVYAPSIAYARGDFLSLGWEQPDSYYKNSIKKFCETNPEVTFFIFSDDMDYCKLHAEELGLLYAKQDPVYIKDNINGNNYIDMQLMAHCKGLILCKSVFSYLAALLNNNADKFICQLGDLFEN